MDVPVTAGNCTYRGKKQRGALPPAPSEFASQGVPGRRCQVLARGVHARRQRRMSTHTCTPMKKAPDDAGAFLALN